MQPCLPFQYFADVATSLTWKQIRLSPRWTEQVKADGSFFIFLCVSIACSGPLYVCWLCKAHHQLKTRIHLVITPDLRQQGKDLMKPKNVLLNGFYQKPADTLVWPQALRGYLARPPQTNVSSQVLSAVKQGGWWEDRQALHPKRMALSFRSPPSPSFSWWVSSFPTGTH